MARFSPRPERVRMDPKNRTGEIPPCPSDQSFAGVAYAVSAFLIWGVSPIYWKTLKAVPALEIIMHRVVWSFLFLILVVMVQNRWQELRQALTHPRSLAWLTLSTLFISVNWLIFIWAVNNDYVLQTSLGYYINPLVSVVLGMIFLRERLRILQLAAVLTAAAGVFYLTIDYGRFPWIALSLAFSFGFYGLIRKVVAVGSLIGLTVETLLLSGPALAYLAYLDHTGVGAFGRVGAGVDLLLMATALFTGLPLLFFALGTRRLHLSTVGFLQYIAPSCFFLLAVFVYREPISTAQIWTFALIWVALGCYSTDSILHYRRLQQDRRAITA